KLRARIDALETKLKELDARIQSEFPRYAELVSPKPLPVADVQKLVGPNEALVLFHVGEKASFVWAISQERSEWREIKLGKAELDRRVQELRDSLDIGAALADRSAAARFKDFDLAAAYELYSAVLGPVEPVLSGRSHLIVVPAGALTSLPLQVLVTT